MNQPVLRREDSRTRASTWLRTRTLAALDSFLIVGALGVYLKTALLAEHWESVARFLDKAHAENLTPLDRLGFFYNDLTLNVLIVPVVATALVCLLSGRYCVVVAFAASVAMSLFYFVELRAQSETGQYLSREVLEDAFAWVASNPGTGADYLTTASVIKLAVLLGALAAIAAIARCARQAEQHSWRKARRYEWALRIPAIGVLGTAVLLAPLSYACRLRDSGLNGSAVGHALATTFGGGGPQDGATLGTFEQALQVSRRMTGTPALDTGHDFVGSERGSDLIVFMMETGPARALDFAAVGGDLPGLGPLFDQAFVAREHYTTHPFSSDALYSVLSGLHPQGRRQALRNAGRGSRNGLMTALAPEASLRRVYLPGLYGLELDRLMYGAFGADLYVADEQLSDPLREVGARRAEALIEGLEQQGHALPSPTREVLRVRLTADLQAIERTRADIAAAVRAGRRYSVLVFPEIGHAPWLPLRSEPTVLARGRTLMLLQDLWLKEIVDTVRVLGRLDRTVIAVTADHGIRTKIEDPSLQSGRINDYTFRVPLLVYAPRALQRTMMLTAPTSHIDVAPTLLALLGKTDAAGSMQGVPLWQRTRGDRIFVWASAYGGADGFTQGGNYYMRQALSGSVYRATSFSFTDADLVTSGDVPSFVEKTLAAADQLQHGLAARSVAERRSMSTR